MSLRKFSSKARNKRCFFSSSFLNECVEIVHNFRLLFSPSSFFLLPFYLDGSFSFNFIIVGENSAQRKSEQHVPARTRGPFAKCSNKGELHKQFGILHGGNSFRRCQSRSRNDTSYLAVHRVLNTFQLARKLTRAATAVRASLDLLGYRLFHGMCRSQCCVGTGLVLVRNSRFTLHRQIFKSTFQPVYVRAYAYLRFANQMLAVNERFRMRIISTDTNTTSTRNAII